MQEVYARAGIDAEYQNAHGDCSECLKAVRDGRNVFITGGNGSGKSMLAALVAMRLLDSGVRARFVNAAIVAQQIKNDFDTGGNEAWERMCKEPVLVLDDLGKGNPTEWDVSMWYSVTEARNAANRPTIVTTNYDGGELISRLTVGFNDSTAKAIVSRLRGGAFLVRMDGKDKRLKR